MFKRGDIVKEEWGSYNKTIPQTAPIAIKEIWHLKNIQRVPFHTYISFERSFDSISQVFCYFTLANCYHFIERYGFAPIFDYKLHFLIVSLLRETTIVKYIEWNESVI